MATVAERLAALLELEDRAVARLEAIDLSVAALEYGATWYAREQLEVRRRAERAGVSWHAYAGAVAALSPRMTWAKNVEAVDRLIADREARVGMRANVRKALAILEGRDALEVLGGAKVRRFYLNLIGQWDAVTIDIWALRAAVDDDAGEADYKRITGRVGGYEALERAYRRAAAVRGMAPAVFQAAAWVAVRGAHA